ncbi:MAG: hypothetical protein JKY62_16960 [Desulfocapsa sp.]|nr:hypothetical protein [Desulfocapsa sp.]
MNDLQLYHHYQTKIAELKKKVRLLQANNSHWKCKYEKLLGRKLKVKRVSRTADARPYVQAWLDGDKSMSPQDIADKFCLQVGTVGAIASQLRKRKKKNEI